MDYRYLPVTGEDKEEMLKTIGVDAIDELFEDVPENIRFAGEMDLPKALGETDLLKEMKRLSDRNANVQDCVSYLGAGVYEHYIPTVVDHVLRRSEFYTAYTPYQPEISQGELQAIFEFQTMISELTGMDIANSSMYDGPTALAEAALMAASENRGKRRTIVVSETIHPEALDVLKTYAAGPGLTVKIVPEKDGRTDLDKLEKTIDADTAGVIVQYPNFYGTIEDLAAVRQAADKENSLMIVSANPLSLGILTPPGHFGADIVAGDAQPLGIPMQFGGPHCGFFATTKKHIRKVPGRLVGQTEDEDGSRGYVLTLQAREQHIRRDKATSNICSNQALNALAASVAMTALGKKGLRETAERNIKGTHFLKQLLKQKGIQVVHESPSFNEFVINLSRPVSEVNEQLFQHGIIGGYDLGKVSADKKGQMLVCVTELRTREQLETFADQLEVLIHETA
ncbi:glycine dehydrogenase (aminomethyl-transferring) [Marinococcus halophilus]|uniref:Probable glycine dehydrogenase (decarboxylating) subunit 1 n=1 Tax=Marinococcus halophilus TaxID=1371 RepID=A0A510Y7M4_MARHA|nr:aminomethyl-transferring glycine dehydrogenase subunit GcvPA [Marinococcus halophilus]OZT80981.1 glycine dehydrogenase (aminomethyl-transferring) [Marinococcus halophilus]GEK59364.1 putative glycine dehydrogenase (decarboxylating) subunit 1 [Marinococcus halophilus]